MHLRRVINRRTVTLAALLVSTAVRADLAFAQADSWVLAQQAMARFDYVAALKYAADTVAKNPQNIEAKRMAAKAARELEKFPECLRFIGEIPLGQISSDDVGIVGECTRGNPSPKIITFFQQQMSVPDNREMASYWLGRFAYLREEYKLSEKYLLQIQVLPDRLERERQRMLVRIRDVLRAAQPPPVVVLPSPVPQPTPVVFVPPPVATPVPPASAPVVLRFERLGLFSDYEWTTDAAWEYEKTKNQVLLEPFTQTEYERVGTTDAIHENEFAGSRYAGGVRIDGEFGYRGRVSRAVVLTGVMRGAVAATVSNRRYWIYTPPGELRSPAETLGVPARGFEARAQPELNLQIGRNFEVVTQGLVRINMPDNTHRRTLTGIDSWAEFKYEKVRLNGGYRYDRFSGVDGNVGLIGATFRSDVEVNGLGILAFRTFDSYPLLRYSRFVSNTNSPSGEAVRFMVAEGDFFELNFVPRLHFSYLEFFGWYRYWLGTKRQFWSAQDVRSYYRIGSIDKVSKVKGVYLPSALYQMANSELSTGVEIFLSPTIRAVAGATWRTMRGAGSDFSPKDEKDREKKPGYFRYLLDNSGEDTTRFFLSIQAAN